MCTARFLRRSVSFVSETGHQVNEDFRSAQRPYRSFGKGNERKLPRRHFACKRKEADPIKDGVLWIQSSSHVIRNWKLRYVMLFDEKLCYMKETQGDSSRKKEWKTIKISDIVSVKISSESPSQALDSDIFCVKTSRSKILFRCQDQDERDNWITALLTAKSVHLLGENKAKPARE